MFYHDAYKALAIKLDSFPQGYPETETGKELEILAYLFTPEEANLASHASLECQTLRALSQMSGCSLGDAANLVKSMASKGLVHLKRSEKGIEVMLYPFVVGFYENQVNRMDATFAQFFEDYFHGAFSNLLSITPQFHRVVPVRETIQSNIEIIPEEDVIHLLEQKNAWAVLDCICRKQQSLLGHPCEHPVHVCLGMSDVPGAFDGSDTLEALDLEGAIEVLEKAAEAGLVHTVSNHKQDISYVCSCCTCSCGLLRGIAEAGIANVVARSSYAAEVIQEACIGCGVCEDQCQFTAITVENTAGINTIKCVGCGICVRSCPEEAISLLRRPQEDILAIPDTQQDWLADRKEYRKSAQVSK